MSLDFSSMVLAKRIKEKFILADLITGENYPIAASVIGASAVVAVVAIGGVFYLVRRCRARDIEQPADEQVGLTGKICIYIYFFFSKPKWYKSKRKRGRLP